MEPRVYALLRNLNVIHELGRQRCFELGNPYYYQDGEDRNLPGNEKDTYYRKELPTGELFLVEVQISQGLDQSYQIIDKVIRQLK